MLLTRSTALQCDRVTPPVQTALAILRRDMNNTLTAADTPGGAVRFCRRAGPPESWAIETAGDTLTVWAADDLGTVYGALEVSRRFLGVQDLWFWNDQTFTPRPAVEVPDSFAAHSEPFAVHYRGWFINDEVLLHTWRVDNDPDEPWCMAFEALLRLGGNLIIPGTGRNAQQYRALAANYGLIITHHHAEPLGAEMFARRYPELEASYRRYPERFEGLWREALAAQRDIPVIYNIGFRGQGDQPFWTCDPDCDTPRKRGEVLSALLRRQYELVQQMAPGARCCTNLYGEAMELYRQGYLHLPPRVIRLWGDNGYGKMVSRRQGDHDPRVPSLPDGGDGGSHGVYYHVSFYDLQAAGHITTLPNPPEFVAAELGEVLRRGGSEMWIINASNIKPHVYLLSLIAALWQRGTVDTEAFGLGYFARYYDASQAHQLLDCQRQYWKNTPHFGPLPDQRGADQFPNYTVRALAAQYLQDRQAPSQDLFWACRTGTLRGQLEWARDLFAGAAAAWQAYAAQCAALEQKLPPAAARLFADSIQLQAELLRHCHTGAALAAEAMLDGLAGDDVPAFYKAGQAREAFLAGNAALRAREHGKWHGFYANECLTDVKFTAYVLEGLMHLFRARGDGAEYWQWQRRFACPPSDRRVLLVTHFENRLTNQELYEKMKAAWEDAAAPGDGTAEK